MHIDLAPISPFNQYATSAISRASPPGCGVETVMEDNLLIKVEIFEDRIFMRLKRAYTVAFNEVAGLGKLPFYH